MEATMLFSGLSLVAGVNVYLAMYCHSGLQRLWFPAAAYCANRTCCQTQQWCFFSFIWTVFVAQPHKAAYPASHTV